jgi:hypothetical protein
MKKIMIMMVMLVAAIAATAQNTKSATQDSTIAALQAENAKLRNDLQSVTAAGQANSKGCFHLHVDTLRRTIKGVEPCNGFYAGVGGGYDFMSYECADENVKDNTGAAVLTAKVGYRHFWFRPELSFTGGFAETVDGRDYTMAKFKAVVNIDFLRFAKVSHKHCPIDPYFFAGISYNVIQSKKETGVGTIPYDGNQFRAETGVGAMFKLGTFNNGRTNVVAGGKKVSLKKKSEIFFDINVPLSYGTLKKPRLTEAEQPVMKCWSVTPTASLVVKF